MQLPKLDSSTKYKGFIFVMSCATYLAATDTFTAETAAFFGTITGAFFGFQAGKASERKKNGEV